MIVPNHNAMVCGSLRPTLSLSNTTSHGCCVAESGGKTNTSCNTLTSKGNAQQLFSLYYSCTEAGRKEKKSIYTWTHWFQRDWWSRAHRPTCSCSIYTSLSSSQARLNIAKLFQACSASCSLSLSPALLLNGFTAGSLTPGASKPRDALLASSPCSLFAQNRQKRVLLGRKLQPITDPTFLCVGATFECVQIKSLPIFLFREIAPEWWHHVQPEWISMGQTGWSLHVTASFRFYKLRF